MRKWPGGTYIGPFLEFLLIFAPVNLKANVVSVHLVKVLVSYGHCVEVFSPDELCCQLGRGDDIIQLKKEKKRCTK